jgi:hypothetical protein
MSSDIEGTAFPASLALDVDYSAPPETNLDRVEREEELLAALRESERKFLEQKALYADLEQTMSNRLGGEITRQLQTDVERCFQQILLGLEEALSQILVPFLMEEVRRKTITELADLVRRELGDPDAPVINVRAPLELHDALARMSEQSSIALNLTESDEIEIAIGAQRVRFEQLSAQWLAVIEGIAQ